MDTGKCRALLTVIECGSLAAAAEALGYTTSGISRMMASLENELGFTLLVRGKTGVRPTAECQRILPTLTQLATLGESCEQQASLIRGVEVGHVHVGCAYRPFFGPLARVLDDFSAVHPHVDTNLTVQNSTPLVRLLEHGEIDLAVISRREGDFSWTPLVDDPIVAMVPADHPLAGADAYPLRRFAQDPFILLYPDEESDNSRVLAKYHIHPRSHNTVRELREARELVAIGLGVTMINRIYADWSDDRVRILPLSPEVNIPIGVASAHRDLASPAAQAFADFALPRLREAADAFARGEGSRRPRAVGKAGIGKAGIDKA